jgi:predicted nucleotidyltransferase component of viral defense system
MINWLNLTEREQIDLFTQAAVNTGLRPFAIEKDAWVTLMLRMIFGSSLKQHIVFKGGTSLSKCYNLIKRFSEDIDFSIDREFLGFSGDLSKGELRKLRRKSHEFTVEELPLILTEELNNYKIDPNLYEIELPNQKITDQDPEILLLNYKSVFNDEEYLVSSVQIEIGARSLFEPFERIEINSIIDKVFTDKEFSEKKFTVNAVIPEKTLIEKLILLHEEFNKTESKVKHKRMSRHLYDIFVLMNTKYFSDAKNNTELFKEICRHREKFTPLKPVGSLDYSKLAFDELEITPPINLISDYKTDYSEMRQSMIYGESPTFDELISKLKSINIS